MAAIIGFIFFVINALLGLLALAIIISAILSWLFAFDIINHRNRFVNQLSSALDAIVWPVMAPFRKIIPPLGGIDITPIIVLILIQGVRGYLLPESHAALLRLFAGY